MPTTFCASQWPCGSVLLGDFGIGGMLIGEGSVMFVLKKLEHAIADGDKARLRPPDTAPRPPPPLPL